MTPHAHMIEKDSSMLLKMHIIIMEIYKRSNRVTVCWEPYPQSILSYR